ncbi:hypothetical protein HMPREF1317_1804, partial [Schaalia georgiae F0490]
MPRRHRASTRRWSHPTLTHCGPGGADGERASHGAPLCGAFELPVLNVGDAPGPDGCPRNSWPGPRCWSEPFGAACRSRCGGVSSMMRAHVVRDVDLGIRGVPLIVVLVVRCRGGVCGLCVVGGAGGSG